MENQENSQKRICPKCKGNNVVRSGIGWKNRPRYVCKDCWKTFYLEDNEEL